jgi:hypothetical protein
MQRREAMGTLSGSGSEYFSGCVDGDALLCTNSAVGEVGIPSGGGKTIKFIE